MRRAHALLAVAVISAVIMLGGTLYAIREVASARHAACEQSDRKWDRVADFLEPFGSTSRDPENFEAFIAELRSPTCP